MRKIFTIFLTVGVMILSTLCSGLVESSEPILPNTVSVETAPITTKTSDRSDELSEIDAVEKITLINSVLIEKDVMGGDFYAGS